MDFAIPISPETLALVAKILVGAQAIKKLLESSWFNWLITKITGGPAITAALAVAVTAVVGIGLGVQQYAPDGLTMDEIFSIIGAIFGANGTFLLGKSLFQPKNFVVK